MKIAIAGFDREGRSTLAYLQSRADMRKAEIWILDKNPSIKIPKGLYAKLGKNYLSNLKGFDIIYRTPGLPYLLPEIQHAKTLGTKISSATKLFFNEARQLRNRPLIIGVTGTKGKGTTSTLIYKILSAAKKQVFLAGNIGTPVLDILPKLKKVTGAHPIVVLELSSFQLQDVEASPDIAVALMITSEHMDWHKDLKEYVSAKSRIVRFQTKENVAVLAQDYPRSAGYARVTKAHVLGFSRRNVLKKGTYVKNGNFVFSDGHKKDIVCPTNILRIPGEHNWDNAAAAITVAKTLHIPNAIIKKELANFKGLPNRLEFIKESRGVRYYNDSYATTPETTEVAIMAFSAPKILILGGSSKGSNFTKLGRAISRSTSIKAIIGIGVEWPRIKTHIHNTKILTVEGLKNMREIIREVRSIATPGDVVLLSPACASFGMFTNYTERGAEFRTAVMKLK